MVPEFVAYLDLEGECRRVGIHFYSMEQGPLLILKGKWLEPSPSNDDKGDQGPGPDQDGGPSATKDEEAFGGGEGPATDFRQDNENPEVKSILKMNLH